MPAAKNGGGSVPLVDVAVYGHGASYLAILLQAANGHGHVVDHTKAFSVVAEGMEKAAADVDSALFGHSMFGCQDGPARGQPECPHQFRGIGHLQGEFLAR